MKRRITKKIVCVLVFAFLGLSAFVQAQDQQRKRAAGAMATPASTTTDSPSLSDTLAWLKQTLDAVGHADISRHGTIGWNATDIYRSKINGYDGCAVMLSFDFRSLGTYPDGRDMKSLIDLSEVAKLSLGDLDPTAIELGVDKAGSSEDASWTPDIFYIKSVTTNRKESISVLATRPGNPPSQQKASELRLYVSGEEIRPRIVKALGHAIELCGGKKSVF